MPFIGPPRKATELADHAQTTHHGKGHPPAPGVTSDALKVSKEDWAQNGKLAEAIKGVFAAAKGRKHGKPLFVLAWRMYPNAENPFWQNRALHNCGCGCACSSHPKKRQSPSGGDE
jgi:hypothetical protein